MWFFFCKKKTAQAAVGRSMQGCAHLVQRSPCGYALPCHVLAIKNICGSQNIASHKRQRIYVFFFSFLYGFLLPIILCFFFVSSLCLFFSRCFPVSVLFLLFSSPVLILLFLLVFPLRMEVMKRWRESRTTLPFICFIQTNYNFFKKKIHWNCFHFLQNIVHLLKLRRKSKMDFGFTLRNHVFFCCCCYFSLKLKLC